MAVFTTQADSDGCVAEANARLGYPKLGRDVGAGFHAPPIASLFLAFKKPAASEWGIPFDGPLSVEDAKQPLPTLTKSASKPDVDVWLGGASLP